jgi:hypothetical protein
MRVLPLLLDRRLPPTPILRRDGVGAATGIIAVVVVVKLTDHAALVNSFII